MHEPPSSFGMELRRVRVAKGWTLREAARHLGVSFSRLGTWERGIDSNTKLPVVPPYQTARLMARVLQAPQLLAAAGYPIAGVSDDENELLEGFRRLGAGERATLVGLVREMLAAAQGAERDSHPGSEPGRTEGATGEAGNAT